MPAPIAVATLSMTGKRNPLTITTSMIAVIAAHVAR
jgi:hypothetical protein